MLRSRTRFQSAAGMLVVAIKRHWCESSMLHVKHNILIVNVHRALTVDGIVKCVLKKGDQLIN
jgi:hypothetical protein